MSLGILTASLRTLKNLQTVPSDLVGYVASRIKEDDDDYSHIKKRKSRFQMCLISACVCGIEFCYAAETAFVSPTLLQIGLPVMYMSMVWCLSPILGLILVPLLGSLSDRCKFRLGRRRPFILILSAGIILGLVLVPNGRDIGILLGDDYGDGRIADVSTKDTLIRNVTRTERLDERNDTDFNVFFRGAPPAKDNLPAEEQTVTDAYDDSSDEDEANNRSKPESHPFSILFTVLGVVLLDFSCDACQSPCRAYMLDVTVPEDNPRGLTTFTILAGLGGACGYLLGGIDWGGAGTSAASMSNHIRIVFTMVLIIYLVCVTITITSFKEVPLEKLGITEEQLQKKRKKVGRQSYQKFRNEDETDSDTEQKPDYGSQKETNIKELISHRNISQQQNSNEKNDKRIEYGYDQQESDPIPNGVEKYRQEQTPDYRKEASSILSNPTNQQFYKDEQTISKPQPTEMPMGTEVNLKTYLKSIIHIPRSLLILCLTNLFCWMSLLCYSLYFTDFVGQAIYFGDPSAAEGTLGHDRYETGVRMGSFGMALYSLSCSVYSLSIEKLVAMFGAKKVYICSQLVYTVGSIVLALVKHKVAVFLLSPTAGIMYATLFTLPYLLVAHYHSNDTFEELVDGKLQKKSEQVRGLGTDIAIVSSMVFFAQVILSLGMGSLIHLCGSTVAVVWSAAALSFCGAITATQGLEGIFLSERPLPWDLREQILV